MKKSSSIMISLATLIFIIVVLITYFIIYITFNSNNKQNIKRIGIDSRTININISDNKIMCEDVMNFNVPLAKDVWYNFFKENEYLKNAKLYIKNTDNSYSLISDFDISKGYIHLNEIMSKDLNDYNDSNKKINIKLTYELDFNCITRYTNTDVFPFYIDVDSISYLNNLTINLKSNKDITNFNIESIKNAEISKTTDGYIVYMNDLNNSINMYMLFNIDIQLNKIRNSDYIAPDVLNEIKEYEYIDERIYILILVIIISLLLLIISLILNRHKKLTNYRRDTSNLVSPILAEAIIDGKIGLKELFMTTIIELSIRGNINIINNDTLELVSCDNLETYEQSIVNLLFKNKVIKFSDINNTFTNSNKSTNKFTKKISLIKEHLLEKIYSVNIFSKWLTIFNKAIGLCAILICINLPQIFIETTSSEKELFILLSIIITLYYLKGIMGKRTIKEEIIANNKKLKGTDITAILAIVFLLILIISTSINVAKYHIIFFVVTLLTICLNIYIAYRSQYTILTKKGKEEQLKLLELKKYINDYSLIKNRDLESAIIWDRYLAYATAFGIPNKITSSIYEKWYNINIDLQVVKIIFS